MKTLNLIPFIALLGVVACGGSSGGSSSKKQDEIVLADAVDGTYHAHLRPVNPHASGFLPHGGATFKVAGDNLTVKTYLDDDSAVTHRQSVHMGSACPTAAHDTNRDGFVDYQEALRAVGKVLIPLDANLESQDAGAEVYPKGSSFTYTKTASIQGMLTDLWAPDKSPNDEFAKLSRGNGMKLVGRVVLIHGTYTYDGLPETLATRGTEPANLTIPVACGVIETVL